MSKRTPKDKQINTPSKVFVITPDQLAKLGLATKIKDVVGQKLSSAKENVKESNSASPKITGTKRKRTSITNVEVLEEAAGSSKTINDSVDSDTKVSRAKRIRKEDEKDNSKEADAAGKAFTNFSTPKNTRRSTTLKAQQSNESNPEEQKTKNVTSNKIDENDVQQKSTDVKTKGRSSINAVTPKNTRRSASTLKTNASIESISEDQNITNIKSLVNNNIKHEKVKVKSSPAQKDDKKEDKGEQNDVVNKQVKCEEVRQHSIVTKDLNDSTMSETVNDDTPTLKRRAGRPRKVKTEESPSVETKTPRRVGRPRKLKVRDDLHVSPETDAIDESSEKPEENIFSTPDTVTKRKRRPNTLLIKDYDVDIETDIPEEVVTSTPNDRVTKRKRKENSLLEKDCETNITEENYCSTLDEEVTMRKRTANTSEIDISEEIEETPKKRGGKTPAYEKKKTGKRMLPTSVLYQVVVQYVNRVKKIIAGEETPTFFFYKENEQDNDSKCVMCKKDVNRKSFYNHKLLRHNNFAWIEGDTPIPLEVDAIHTILLNYSKKRPFKCDFCADTYKSMIGFLTHFASCGKNEMEMENLKVKCEFCDMLYFPAILPSHVKIAHADLRVRKYKKREVAIIEEREETVSKRKSACKALQLIEEIKNKGSIVDNSSPYIVKNFNFNQKRNGKRKLKEELSNGQTVKCRFEGCDYSTANLEEIMNHLNTCENKPTENFTCKVCLLPFKTLEDSEKHVENVHTDKEYKGNDEGEDDDDDDDDNSDMERSEHKGSSYKSKGFVLRNENLLFLRGTRGDRSSKYKLFNVAIDWTLELINEHYDECLNDFLRFFKKNYAVLENKYLFNYMPKLLQSINVGLVLIKTIVMNPKNFQLKRFKLFETCLDNDENVILFCGGPIQTMAWLPTLHTEENCDQILAVSVNLNPNYGVTNIFEKTPKRGMIQFWNFKNLQNTSSPDKPELYFCFVHDYGVLNDMAWCPSGCYEVSNDDFSRLGLLAIASRDSNVYIYAVHRWSGNKMLKPTPAARLNFDNIRTNNGCRDGDYYPTRIFWSKAKNHNHIVVGYNNGIVALYHVTNSLNIAEEEEMLLIKPYQVIQAHDSAVTFVSLNTLNGGNRWLITGSMDKYIKYWDLLANVNIYSLKRMHVTNGVWPSYWLGAITSFDECSLTLPNATCINNFRLNEKSLLLYTSCTTTSVDYSMWNNIVIHGSSMGDVSGTMQHQLFCNMEGDKYANKKKFLSGYSKIIDISDKCITKKEESTSESNGNKQIAAADEVRTYEEANNKYAVIFCDTVLSKQKDWINVTHVTAKTGIFEESKPNMYPLQAVNKIAINPNRYSFNYYAIGYQIGFIKVKRAWKYL